MGSKISFTFPVEENARPFMPLIAQTFIKTNLHTLLI